MIRQRKYRDRRSPFTAADASRTDDGFALVTVIWIAGILATAAFIATSAVTSRVRTVDALIASAEAEAAADAGVSLAIAATLSRAQPTQTVSLFAPPIVCRLNDRTAVRVDVSDEAGKIDLNFASEEILRALMTGLGWAPEIAGARIDALHDYIDPDSDVTGNGGEEPQYREAGRASGPRNGPLASILELGQVLGFDQASLSPLYPHVTVHSGQSGVDPLVATVELRALLENGANGEKFDASKRLSAAPTLPNQFRTSSTQYAMTITSQGVTTTGARFIREAVVSFSQSSTRRPPEYRVWRWARGTANGSLTNVDAHGDKSRC